MSEFLGSRISLISKSDIRYVGTLHEINSDESTVSLENVRSFGTEGRKGRSEEEISPSDQVYEYIVFRGSDVKDLRIEEHPNIKENKPPAVPDDPAIVGARARPGAQGPNQNAPPGPGAFGQGPQGPYPPNNFYGGPPPGNWGRGGAPPGPGPGPNFGNMPYPPPPGWFPPGQGFPGGPGGPNPPGGPGGPAPWGNYPFPPGPGGPGGSGPNAPAEVAANQRGTPSSGPSQDAKPAPIGLGADRAKDGTPSGQVAPPTEPKSLAQGVRQPSHAPTPPVDSKPSIEEVKQTAANLTANGQAAAEASKAAPTGPRNHRVNPVIPLTGSAAKPFSLPGIGGDAAGKAPAPVAPTNVQDATSAARAAVAVAMAQLGNNGGNAMDNLTNKVNEMRVNAVRGGPVSRGRGRGGRPAPAKVAVPDSDFDFAQSNAKFNKHDLAKEAIAGSPSEIPEHPPVTEQPEAPTTGDDVPVAYNKSRSFFDNISSESRERTENGGQKPGGREWRGEEQRKNMETFGQGSVDGGYRNYRGRGRGRGRGGRGGGGSYPRGGRGGNRPQYQAAPGQQ
ncbi:Like-Sm ribonucleoprotein (LSM)-related domain-containing protein [Fusarium heterosporum]|uniref:Like-Sm ribonucleoprotein (LSM)-related domain-containing protein n=1 Tax=Fusarium heterosporum TaxID=42747 RepID=A0A8H5WKI0_FUSHE|nr:Like-Sm ribonucleoprotein (LSM)-related domain-containing protein [Fusarium heterosporum]